MGKTACFNPRSIQLREPIDRGNGLFLTHVNVPCGKCENCIRRRRAEWCFRMEEELKRSKCAYFVTLTYERVKYDQWGNMTLAPEDLTRYFKRLRQNEKRNFKYMEKGFCKRKGKKIMCHPTYEVLYNGLRENDKLSYYACGEYGSEFGRPHYHAIIFNASRKFISESWGLGYVHIKNATPESIAYVTKYMDKWRNKKQDWRKCKEFNRSSEGLGYSFTERMSEFYAKNLDINYVMNDRGMKIAMPRVFRLRMLNEMKIKEQRVLINDTLEKLRNEYIDKLGLEEYNKRELGRMRYVQRNFNKGEKKRGF